MQHLVEMAPSRPVHLQDHSCNETNRALWTKWKTIPATGTAIFIICWVSVLSRIKDERTSRSLLEQPLYNMSVSSLILQSQEAEKFDTNLVSVMFNKHDWQTYLSSCHRREGIEGDCGSRFREMISGSQWGSMWQGRLNLRIGII